MKKSSGTLYWRSIAGDALAESDLSGNIQNEYVFFAGRRIARISGSTVNYFYSDALGTTHTITDATGHACYDASFTPYGQETLNPNISQTCSSNYKFTGYEYDSETGLYYAFARYYNPRIGRFMSIDPAGGSQFNPQTLDRYAYVSNAPTMFSDPSGLGSNPCPLVIAGAGENPNNSPAVQQFASAIGANVVYPEPNPNTAYPLIGLSVAAANIPTEWGGGVSGYPYSASGIAAVQQGIAASSGPNGGPSTVIAFSIGSGYYSEAAASTPNSTPGTMAYVMPFMPGTSPVYGTSGTFLYSGTGLANDYLQSGGNDVPGATQISTASTHDANVFSQLLNPTTTTAGQQLAYAPYLRGQPKCEHPGKPIVAGGGGGGGGGYVDFWFLLYYLFGGMHHDL